MDATRMGTNRTGVQMSPVDAKALLEAARDTVPSSEGDATAIAALREPYLLEADPVGTMPVPGTLGGTAKAGMEMFKGNRPHALLDKLGERLAFERGGTRLYEAFIGKCEARSDELADIDLTTLRRFRDEEHQHVLLVAEAIAQLGGDPTAQTPCADLVGVTNLGVVQAVVDPRTTVLQSLQAVFIAELVDGESWDLLVTMLRDAGHDAIAERFEQAQAEEAEHLETIRAWLAQGVLATGRVGERPAAH